ncbi:MAG: alpha/beta fold hydrolase [Candidatus Zixiibacteriota bacterium]|nr:MAG: alpha/beta fold hydrolase [candidate division Zixibacteria bacterium]
MNKLRKRTCRFVILLCVVSILPAWAHAADEGTVPRFEIETIPDEIAPKTGSVVFGYLIVYEDRKIADSKTIRLPVMIGKARSDNPKPDPVIFTVGGPGVMSTMRGGRDLDDWPYLDDRDFIYFEQRGAQYAEPSLVGPEIDSLVTASFSKCINGQPARGDLVSAARRMKERLLSAGIDPSCYSTRESAADLEDLRTVLGIEKWNLYGISYSCRLMLEVVRRYPEGVRSVILDSPLPPDVSWDETSLVRYWNNFVKLTEACEADPEVRSKYSNLKDRFLALVREAEANPLELSVRDPITGGDAAIKVDGRGLFNLVAAYMGFGSYVYGFPRSIHMICERHPEALAYFARELINPEHYAWGMRYSVWCNEEFPFEDFNKFAGHENLPSPLNEMTWTVVEPEIYDFWPRRELDSLDNQPVSSDIPTLVTNGQFDPDTPPEWGQKVCRTLSRSYYFEFPGQSHLPLFNHPCGRQLGIDFLNDPYTRPSEDCLASHQPFKFYSGE